MFCEKCGNKLEDDALFCNKCGSRTQIGSTDDSSSDIPNPTPHDSANYQSQPVITSTNNNAIRPKMRINIIESLKLVEKKTIGKFLLFGLVTLIISQVYLMNAETKEMKRQYGFMIIDGQHFTHDQFLSGEIPESVWSTDEFKKEMHGLLWGMSALDAEQIGNRRGWDWPQDVWHYWFGKDNTNNTNPNEIIDVGRGIKMPAYAFYYYMGVDMASSSSSSANDLQRSSSAIEPASSSTTSQIDTSEAGFEELLLQAMSGQMIFFEYADFDNDGYFEAFAVCSSGEPYYGIYDDSQLWFANKSGAMCLNEKLGGGYPNDSLIVNNHQYIVWELSGGGSGSTSVVYGVKNGMPYEPYVSMQYMQFGFRDGELQGTEQAITIDGRQSIEHYFYYDEAMREFYEFEAINHTYGSASSGISNTRVADGRLSMAGMSHMGDFSELAVEIEKNNLKFELVEDEPGVDAYCLLEGGDWGDIIIARAGRQAGAAYMHESIENLRPAVIKVYYMPHMGFAVDYLAVNEELEVYMSYDEVLSVAQHSNLVESYDERQLLIDGVNYETITILYEYYLVTYKFDSDSSAEISVLSTL